MASHIMSIGFFFEVIQMERKQFTFYRSFYDVAKKMPEEERGKLLFAICSYALDEEEIQLDGMSEIAFMLIKPNLDSSRRKAQSGASGGEAGAGKTKSKPKAKNSKSEANKKQEGIDSKDKSMEEEKQTDTEKEKEKEKELKIEDKIEIDTEIENNIFYLPLKDNTMFAISKTQVEEWTLLYPDVNIMQELRNMYGWLDVNPQKRKTRMGMKRFINNWLLRAQNKEDFIIHKNYEYQKKEELPYRYPTEEEFRSQGYNGF